jgi:hypothetical protein
VIFGHEAGAALMVHPERGAYFTGLCHCGSVWECPVCAYSIAHGRAEELRELAAAHRATGGGVALLTLTTPHDVGDDLQAMRRHQSWAWSKVQAGAQYKRAKDKIGWVGTVAAREPTHGPNGWHPHIHVLLLTARPLQDPKTGKLGADGQAFLKVVYDRWCNYITVRNPTTGTIYRVPSREHGVTLVPSHKDDYISKMGLADEVTRGSFKTAKERAGHRTAFAILGTIKNELDAGREPSPRDVALWKEYAVAMRGARQLTWSRGLRKRYAIPEQTDMELAEAADALAGAELLVRFTDQFWDRHLRNNYRLRCELLAAATRRGLAGVLPIIDRINGLKVVPF